MISKQKMDKYSLMAEKAFKEAVKKALKEHQRLGVPAVFMQNGKIVYLMPNGKIVDKVRQSKRASKQ
ncbi:hypothetical protein HZB07_01925 [Candidatus Saganbacteria bacterium]|nr:hypothetical protein [Candidatus Saganbacteria bacterium]